MELSKKEKAAYLSSMFGQNIFFALVSSCLMYYWQSVIFLPAAAVSVIFLITKIFDAFKDLVMGTIIDKTHGKTGKCRPYLIVSALPCTLLTVLLFSGKSYGGSFKEIFSAFAVYLLWGLFFALTDVPLWTLPTVMTECEKERNFLLSFARMASTAAAAVVFTAAGFSGEGMKKANELLYAGASFKADPAFAKYRFALFLLFALIPAVFSLLSALPFMKKAKKQARD